MKRKLGYVLVLCGVLMFFAAGLLFFRNYREAEDADRAAQDKLSQLVVQISEKQLQQDVQTTQPTENVPVETSHPAETLATVMPVVPTEPSAPQSTVMDEIVIDGDSYIGYLSFPRFELELPVMSGWSDSKLQISPCRYTGTLVTNDLVIMAHNFARHFGQISELSAGDVVYFTDVNGSTTVYEVIVREILPPDAIEDMTAGEFDLTLFTCTYGGANRITVRCNRK